MTAAGTARESPRRYRAGLDEHDRSTVAPAEGSVTITADGALSVFDLWRSASGTPRLASGRTQDRALDVGVLPGGSRAFVSTFLQAYDSGLHRTATVDVSTVLAGSVSFRTETAVVQLDAGDSVVVPGVLHGWRAGRAGCVLLVVMIGAV